MRHVSIGESKRETTWRAETTQRYLLLFAILALFIAGCTLPEQADQQRREAYLRAHPRLSDREANLIRGGGLWLGMTATEVCASLGTPYRRHQTVTSGGVHEQWIYRWWSDSPAYDVYIYLEDGIVVGWSH